MGKKDKNRAKPINNSAKGKERHKLEVKIRDLELTAERAAQDGDIELYQHLCREVTKEQLKLDFLCRKKSEPIIVEQLAAFAKTKCYICGEINNDFGAIVN